LFSFSFLSGKPKNAHKSISLQGKYDDCGALLQFVSTFDFRSINQTTCRFPVAARMHGLSCAERRSICVAELECLAVKRVELSLLNTKTSYQGSSQRLNPLIEKSRELHKNLCTIQCLEVKGMEESFV
jgi:hypothetical protein